MREDSKVVEMEQSIRVEFANKLFRTNLKGTRLVEVSVSYSENIGCSSITNFKFNGTCGLLKASDGIEWNFLSEDCTPEIASMILDLFIYQDLVDYIEGLPDQIIST